MEGDRNRGREVKESEGGKGLKWIGIEEGS